jgi:metal-dependent amidase/aminoacylase/carboxypeptidase family protein
MPQRMSSEDFCWYLEKAPGMIFRFGTRNEALGCTALAHRSDFRIDEEGMKYAITAFCKYALSYNKE